MLLFLLVYLCNIVTNFNSPSPTLPTLTKDYKNKSCQKVTSIQISSLGAVKISVLGVSIIIILVKLLFHLCNFVSFIKFTSNLSIRLKMRSDEQVCLSPVIMSFLYGLLLSEYEESWYYLLLNLNTTQITFKLPIKKYFSKVTFLVISIYIFSISNSLPCNILCIITFQNCCYFFNKKHPQWLSIILLILSNDIHQNPGPFTNSYFTFMNWNCNSIAKDDFHRLNLIQADNSIFNYDIISLCETSLNDEVVLPDPKDYLNNEYSFIPANKPDNSRHGGVGFYYKNALPLKHRNDLSFSESIVTELKFGRKKIFFTVLYRSPAFTHTSIEFANFISNFKKLHSNIKKEKPYMTFFTGDFNARSQIWYPDGDTSPEGNAIENLISSLGLYQLISEPTDFEPNKNPTCIDLIMTDQPNLILDSGTRPSPDAACHHQIIYCKANFNMPPPRPYEREIWYYQRANRDSLQRCMTNFPWEQHLSLNLDPNWQAKEFTEIFLNIMSNFIPHEMKKILPQDNPWITKPLKTMIKKKNRLYKNYKRHGFQQNDKARMDNFRLECQQAVEDAKSAYLTNLGNKLHNRHQATGKIYWKILNKVINKSKAPKIPILFVDNKFILDCKEKATLFTKFFCKQCIPVVTDSVLPALTYKTNERIDNFQISTNDITPLICKLNPNKATGSDKISAQMLLLCGESAVLPLKLIFSNILSTGIYPSIWKLANVTPIHKKMINSISITIGLYHFYQFVGKSSKR